MSLFGPRVVPLVGVDISPTAVRLLELGRSGARYRIEHYASEPLPRDAVTDKNIADVEAVGAAIARALARSGSKLKHAAAAVAGSAVITRVITMPADLSEDDLEGQIQVEANQYIPYPIEEISLDFEVIGPVSGNPEMNNVLLAASRTENVDMRVAALDLGGLTAKVMDVEAFALENAFPLIGSQLVASPDGIVAVADIGETMTTLVVLRNQRTIYAREQPFGGRQLTEAIARHYEMSWEDAARARFEGGLPASYGTDVLIPFREAVVQQVGRLLQFFYAGSEYTKVEQLVLAGTCASMDGLAARAGRAFDVPCCVANPLANMIAPSKSRDQLIRDTPALMVCAGLAMRSFD